MTAKHPVLCVLLFSFAFPAFSVEWRPVSPEDLALKQSKSEPNADAEALFRDVRIENAISGAKQNITTTYIRVKIFNDRGREKYSNVKIEYFGKANIFDVSGRTIHPDGTVIELKKDAIFDKVEVKKTGLKVKVISLAMPSVEPGSIIEYRWSRNEGEVLYRYIPLDVQSEFPVDEVTFHIKPAQNSYVAMPAMRIMPFGCAPAMGAVDHFGFTPITVRNVPAYHDEPFSPPLRASRQWILIYYEENGNVGKDKYWTTLGKEEYGKAKEHIKVTGEIKQAAAEVTSQGKTDEEKLALLAEYCRKNIKNIHGNDITTEEREGYKPNLTTADTFRRKVGTSEDIDFVFIALAQAAGFEARHALVADRQMFFFTPEFQSHFFLNNSDAAVQLNGKWRFYDVSDEFAPPGSLTWPEQGVYALIPDSKNPEWVQTPLLSSDDSKIQRIAELALSPEGDLEGTIREIYWGNESISWRLAHGKQNDAEREEFVRGRIKERFADFEVSNIKITMAADARKPVGVSYQLHVHGYAQRTGKRIFVNPNFFTAGRSAYFTDANRTNIIYFDYPWSEADSVELRLPAGFQLDHAERPGPLDFPPVGKYAVNMSIANDTNTLVYKRSFTFGGNQIPSFEAKNYKQLKAVFDQIHASDQHMLTLKAMDNPPPATPQ